jgi:drug/metabolite transporter (DMT)-like permease
VSRSPERPGKLLTSLIIITVLVSISSASILVLLSGAPSYACAFWRLLISSIITGTIMIFSGGRLGFLKDPKTFLIVTISGISLGLHFLLWMRSLFLVPVAVSVTIVTAYPFFNVVADVFFLKERIRTRQIMYLVLGFIFLTLFVNPRFSGANLQGSLLALGGAIAASVYFSIGRYLRKRVGLVQYVTPVYLVATFTVLIYSIVTGGNLINYALRTYVFFILLALVPMLGGHTLMNYLLKFMRSSTVTSMALGEPVGATLLAYIILGQKVTALQATLMALVIICLVGVVYEESKEL